MDQLRLFPRPGAIRKPLTREVRSESRELLAEMLIAVIVDRSKERPTPGGDTDE